jgi:hypothetical protein
MGLPFVASGLDGEPGQAGGMEEMTVERSLKPRR